MTIHRLAGILAYGRVGEQKEVAVAKVQNMGHKEREETPEEFARLLVSMVRERYGFVTVAALWVRHDTVYRRTEGVEVWDARHAARKYAGPHPVIAHPPCGPWGKLAWRCIHQHREDGIIAVEMVHLFGGVVEQPMGSRLFRDYGRPMQYSVRVVDQGSHGHRAQKRTLLYEPANPARTYEGGESHERDGELA